MFLLCKPSETKIRDFLAAQARLPYSYDFVGCTLDDPPPRRGWSIDGHRVLLGHGNDVFRKACEAIKSWRMFPPEITTLCWSQGQPEPPRNGLPVAVLYRAAPVRLWLLMAARVISIIQGTAPRQAAPVERFGFAYGTLPAHPERGEERFLIEWDHADDSVWYDLLAVSQPHYWLARLAYPYTRLEQGRFRRLSGAAMQRATS